MLKHLLVSLPFLFIFGCSVSEKTVQEKPSSPNYTLLYIIHADANYTYHMDSKRLSADQEALKEAVTVAEKSRNGEVFIFHQKEESKRFFFFPKKDRVWYHYKGGELLDKGKYSPNGGGLAKEAALFREKRTEGVQKKIMFYYGHEIPADSSLIYHQSSPNQHFDTGIFASDVSLFGNKPFDLMVLSTCNNGNPLMAHKLSGKTNYMVASPRNLHLSYMKSEKISMIEQDPEVSNEAIADSIAKSSFIDLSGSLQTMVTVGVYNLKEIESYISEYSSRYENHLKKIEQKTLFRDNQDCNMLDIFEKDKLNENGAYLYYKSPAFGREAGEESHSVWGCKN